MKRKVIFALICLFFIVTSLNAKDYFYSNGRKFYIKKYDNFAVIQIPNKNKSDIKQKLAQKNTMHIKEVLIPERGIYFFKTSKGKSIYDEANQLYNINILRIIPSYFIKNRHGDTTQ